MTRQQRFYKLVAACEAANTWSGGSHDEVRARFNKAVYELASFCWENEQRITVASDQAARKKRKP